MDLGLKDKVAVITGGSVGIGLGVAQAFAREGAHVLIAARDGARAEAEAKAIEKKYGTQAVAQACDVSTAEGCASLIAEAKASFGGVDILVNNAGTGSNETILNATDEKMARLLEPSRHGSGSACTWPCAVDAGAGWWCHSQQCVDLCGAAAVV